MKLVFLGTSFSIIYFMRFHRVVRNTYDKEQDTFRVMFIIIPCAVLALLINQERSALEVGGAFSCIRPCSLLASICYVVVTAHQDHEKHPGPQCFLGAMPESSHASQKERAISFM